MSSTLDGKVALVTGGGTNIGLATARAFVEEGAAVVIAGRRADVLEQAAERLSSGGGSVRPVVADVTQGAQVRALLADVLEHHGRLDVAFNNAGTVGRPGPTADIDDEVWEQVFAVNVTGTWLCMKHEIEAMRGAGGGTIVNCSSNIGFHGRRPGMSAYAASKAAVSVMTRNAAREYISENIRINSVSPGATDTPLSFRSGEDRAARDERVRGTVPAGRVATPEEIASAVLWLASGRSSYVVGHDLVVDGGTTA